MKKLILFLFSLFLFSIINAEKLSKPLIINTQDWKPYNYNENGKVLGIATNILRQTLDKMEVPYKIKVYPWKRAQYLVKLGEADAFYSASKNSERDEYAISSDSLLPQRWVWYLLKDSDLDPTNEKFKTDYNVGALLGSNMLNFLKTNNYKINAQLPSTEALIQMLLRKRVDAILVNDLVIEEKLKNLNIPEEQFKKILSKNKPLGIYFSKKFINENPWFLDEFNKTLKTYKVE